MSRMTAYRTALAATATAPLLLTVWAAGPAWAHGAPTDPVSRVYACSPDGDRTGTAACRAAIASNGAPFTAWDNLRIANVNGRDRQTVPDGELCSGGLPAYKGLDLARADWPSTRLAPGAAMTMKYVSTIPHTGTFKLYLTQQGYDPTQPLTWSDLPSQPFAEIKDPALTDGAYRIRATLPADRTGRHVLYTIWQNSSTPDTYYSCSDVVFPAAGREGDEREGDEKSAAEPTGAGQRGAASPSPSVTADAKARTSGTPSAAPRTTAPAPATSSPDTAPVASTPTAGSGPSAPLVAGGAAAVLVLIGGAALALRLRGR